MYVPFWGPKSNMEKGIRGACLRSLCVYCPTLSEGKEERAMDNILFYYPPHVAANAQMNQVGFCIGAACLVERFGATRPPDRIQTSHGTTTLCNPFPNLWIAVETTAVYESFAVLPVIRRGFEVFVFRHGWKTISALVSPDVGSAEVLEARKALENFYGNFTVFLETRILVVDIHESIRTARSMTPSSLSAFGTTGTAVGSERVSTERWKRRWAVLAFTESLLAFSVFMRSTPRAVQSTCHGLAYRYLSFLSAGRVRNSLQGSRCSNNNSKNKNHVIDRFYNQSSRTVGWGEEYKGIDSTTVSAATLTKNAEESLLWTCCQYIVFVSETLKVVVFNAAPVVVSRLLCLLLMEPGLTDFDIFTESGHSRCCISHASGITVVFLINADVYRSTHQTILEVCKALAVDIAEYLTSGTCTLTRGGLVDQSEMQQLALTPLNPSHRTAAEFFSTVSHLPKLREMNLTFQWTVWHNGLIIGSQMHEYPRGVRTLLSGMLRALTRELSRKTGGVKGICDVDSANNHQVCSCGIFEEGDVLSSCMQLPSAAKELWMPLSDASWLCVSRRYHHVGGVVFYNPAPLKSCFEATSELFPCMSFLL
ncbi:hypothetical protein TcYC6_0007690 [Trypanosoma cruzi]|nr:hypothetical protein TcYC6_0007690 [Trypanosoma cruzi]